MRINCLTARRVATINADGVYSDGAGLYFRVRGAARHWLFIYTLGGRRREMGLGAPPAVTLAKARELAQAARELVVDGVDPIDHRRAKREVPTFGAMADEWIDGRESSVRNDKSVARWKRAIGESGAAANLRKMKVDAITTDDVLNALKPIWAKGASAKLTQSYIEAVLDAATARKLRSGENPARWRGHLETLLPKPQKLSRGHHKALPYAEVPAFVARLRAMPGVPARCLEFVIATAARSGEAMGATWAEIDLSSKLWSIPGERMKAGKPHVVPLTDGAVELLTALRPKDSKPDAPVFPGRSGDKGLSVMALDMVLRRMEVDATTHGFRSAFRDFAGDMTTHPREVAEAALAHSLGGVEAAYRRASALEKRRALMKDWARWCDGKGAPVNENAESEATAEETAVAV